MAKFDVDVGGSTYEVDAPDESTAWKWARQTHFDAVKKQGQAVAPPPYVAPPKSRMDLAKEAAMPEGLGPILEPIERAGTWAGEHVNDAAAKVLPAPVAAGLGTAANVAMQAVPMVAGGEVAKLASPLFRSGAESLMHSALKPGVGALKTGGGERLAGTMLDEGLNVSRGGVEKGWGAVNGVNDDLAQAIAGSNATLGKGQTASGLSDTMRKFERQVDPGPDVAAIEGVWERFMGHPLLPTDQIPVQLAQQLKQGTYKVLAGKYGEQGSAAVEAQKTLARMLKDGVAKAVPEVAPLNARESALLATMPALERRVLVEANRNPAGLTALISNPAAAAAFMADKSSLFKSMLARMMNAGREQIPANAARGGIAAYLSDQGGE